MNIEQGSRKAETSNGPLEPDLVSTGGGRFSSLIPLYEVFFYEIVD